VQVVFQDPYRSLNPRRTVGASIVEGPMNFGLAEGEALRRARSLLALVGLSPDVLDRYPHQFSGGQRQRIAVARALAMEPEILIADEAVSALDVSVQAQVLELLDDVKRRFDLAVLFITHDLRLAAQICDRIMVMEKGIVVEEGATHRVYSARSIPTRAPSSTRRQAAISPSARLERETRRSNDRRSHHAGARAIEFLSHRQDAESLAVLFVADVLHPIYDLASKTFLNGDMRHRRRRRCAMPMLLAGRKPDHVAWPDFLNRAAPSLRPSDARRDDQCLTEWRRMPGSAGARLECDAGAGSTCWFGGLK